MRTLGDPVVPGTEGMTRYYNERDGINHYGRSTKRGILCFKVASSHERKIRAAGYSVIFRGNSYIYIAR
jgi:hypothetical protein